MKLRDPSLLRTSVVAAGLLLTATAFAQQKSPFYAGFGVGAAMTDGELMLPHGRLDLLGSAAKEAWRQGIDVLLSFDLQCVRREDAWVYRLTATRVALGSMFRRGLYSGDSLDIGFNVTYLLDVLTNVSANEIEIRFNDGNASALFGLADNADFKYVVMPMRI